MRNLRLYHRADYNGSLDVTCRVRSVTVLGLVDEPALADNLTLEAAREAADRLIEVCGSKGRPEVRILKTS